MIPPRGTTPNSRTEITQNMDAFENLMALLLRREGYWTMTSYRVDLTKEQKQEIGRHSSPRWELDLVAYKGSTNEVLVVECKSYLDSYGVTFRNGAFEPVDRYKLFTEPKLREVVLATVLTQLTNKLCPRNPSVKLCLATAKIASRTDRDGLKAHFDSNGWDLFDDKWIQKKLEDCAADGYENDVALVVTKLLMRGREQEY